MKLYVIVALSIFAAAALVGKWAEVSRAADGPSLQWGLSILHLAV